MKLVKVKGDSILIWLNKLSSPKKISNSLEIYSLRKMFLSRLLFLFQRNEEMSTENNSNEFEKSLSEIANTPVHIMLKDIQKRSEKFDKNLNIIFIVGMIILLGVTILAVQFS